MSPPHGDTLRNVLETACREQGCDLKDLTVLSEDRDPYRQCTARHHRDAEWVTRHLERLFRPNQRTHTRGIHYAIVTQGDVRRPNGKVYVNTDEDSKWLEKEAMKAARWLGYIAFDRISDNRNAEPLVFRENAPTGPIFKNLDAGVWVGASEFCLGGIYVNKPEGRLVGFVRAQPYALTIWGEKSSLEDVLLPIARRYHADLYLGMGETSDALIYQMAKDAVTDGRKLIVIAATDCDPGGRQMPVSIGRKLQAFRDLFFPDLRFEVVPAALTVEQVRELGLPSTPLKAAELRADRWREQFGIEQTEIDALATLRPDVLRHIIEAAIEPYYDATLARRTEQAAADWRNQAQEVIDAHVDAEELADIRGNVETIEADSNERIEAIKAETEERVAAENDRLQALVADITLPQAPALPEAELAERAPDSVLVSSDWDWADQTRALKRHKSYGNGEGAP